MRKKKLPSVMDLALAVNRCVSFLAAYDVEDKTKLAELCSGDFYKGQSFVRGSQTSEITRTSASRSRIAGPGIAENRLRPTSPLRSSTEFVSD